MASSAESDERGSVKKKKVTRLGSFSSQEVFRAWASDSLLKHNTVETLIEVHQVDSLPAVLALRSKDLANLGLPIGQKRLFEEAVIKLHAEYTYHEPFSPAIKVDVEAPTYKSMLDDDKSPVECADGNGDYFRFHQFDGSEIGVEINETFCDDKRDKKLLSKDKVEDDDEDDEMRSGCACQRWLFICIFMPLILVLSILGCIGWLLLWPFSRYCPVGKTFSAVFKATGKIMKLPVTSTNWAIGRECGNKSAPEKIRESPEKRNYGGTDDVAMHQLDKPKTDN